MTLTAEIPVDKANAKQQEWLNTPGLFCKEVLDSPTKTDYQQHGFETLLKEKRVCIKSANDMGKTFTIADAILEALYIEGSVYKEAYIILTAPTWNLIKNVTMAEIRKKHKRARLPLGGRVLTTEINLGDKWQLIGFSPRKVKEGDIANFQGFHAPLLIIVFEEATGIPKSIYNMAEGMMTSANVHWWCIGNPTDPSAEFARLFTKFEWVKISWPCYLSPNLIANNIRNIDDIKKESAKVRAMSDENKREYISKYKIVHNELLTTNWVIEKSLDWGIESPLFQSKILAEFPDITDDTLMSIKRVEQCMDASGEEEGFVEYVDNGYITIGVDVARFGSDNTVIKVLRGNCELETEVWSKKDNVFIAGRTKTLINKYSDFRVVCGVDETGVGSGVMDILNNDFVISKTKTIKIVGVIFGGVPINEEKYVNCVSEMWDLLSKQVNSPQGMMLEENDILLSELTARKYKYNDKGKMWIEAKEVYKKRMEGKSCDMADALMIALYMQKLNNKNTALSGALLQTMAGRISED